MISSREQLLGYLLEALEPAEMAAVERELDHDPQLRKDLAAIEAAMFPLGFPEREDDATAADPPRGLTARTCEFVDDTKVDLVARPTPAQVAASHSGMSDVRGGGERNRLRWADLIVAASVCLASVSLIFPAIWTMRERQQIAVCRDNLQRLSVSLANYAGRSPDGRIPLIPASGNRSFAGFYASSLLEQELLEEARWLVCPSSDMAEDIESFRVPLPAELDRATGEALVRMQRSAGGAYAFSLGFVQDGIYQSAKHESRADYCLMSDAPATFPERKTKNHGGRGQNMLYEDGSVRWVVDPCGDLCDNPYLNRSGLVAAGLDCTDVVVAESLAKPQPMLVDWAR